MTHTAASHNATSITTSSIATELAHDLNTIERAGLRRFLRNVEARHGMEVIVDGRPAVDFSSNDYLGLASDPRLAHAINTFLAHEATGSAAARLISGNHPEHIALERDLAAFKQVDATLLFSSGYMANIGAIGALVGRRDVIYTDALNHASLIDAARLSRAEVRVFPHNDLATLRQMLAQDAGTFRRRLIAVDGVFSMDGDLFPLDQLVPLAREFDAWTYVDDAHGTGVLGANGRGVVEHFGLHGDIDVIMGTLGKALGTAGACIASSATVIDFLVHRARSFIFTTNSPPALAAATRAALRIAQDEPWRRTRVRENAQHLRAGLEEIGFSPGGLPDGHIVPVIIGDSNTTVHIGNAMREAGFLVGAVRPPSVPMGSSRLRLTVSAAHTSAHIDALLTALRPLATRHT